MKIKVREIREPVRVTLSGTEEWLNDIYASFEVPEGKDRPLIGGEVVLSVVSEGFVRVRGEVNYRPWLSCSRCGDLVPWDVAAKIDVIYQESPEHVASKREHSLSRGELDEYYFENGCVNLEELLNDTIQMEIPDHVVPCDAEGKRCQVCGIDLGDDQVFGSGAAETKANPFEALRGLRKN